MAACEKLHSVEQRDAKLAALREKLDASIAVGGSFSDDEVESAVATRAAELRGKYG